MRNRIPASGQSNVSIQLVYGLNVHMLHYSFPIAGNGQYAYDATIYRYIAIS